MAMGDTFTLRRWQVRTFLAVYITYFTYYLCRLNMPIAQTPFTAAFGWKKQDFGLVFSALTLCYAVGQFVNGQLADRFGARRIATLGALGSAVMNLCVFVLAWLVLPDALTRRPVLHILVFFWGVNGFFQAMGWSPMVRLMAHWFPTSGRGKIMGLLGTCYQFGAAAASLLAIHLAGEAATRLGGDWRMAFLVPSGILAVVGVFYYLAVRDDPAQAGLGAPDEGSKSDGADRADGSRESVHPGSSLIRNVISTLCNPHLWMVAGVFFMLDLNRYGFVNWLPAYLDAYAPSGGSGEWKKMMQIGIHPLAGSAGALLAGWATDRFFGGRRAPVIVMLLIPLGLLSILFPHLNPSNTPLIVAVVALVGFCTYGPHILMVGHAAQDFGRKSGAAGAAGFIDSVGYIGATLAGREAGRWIDTRGYNTTFAIFGCAALLGAAMACTIWKSGPRLEPPAGERHKQDELPRTSPAGAGPPGS